MKEYYLLENSFEYKYVLIGHTYIHPLSHTQKIMPFLQEKKFSGYVLVDALLSNGFSENRFAKLFFDGQKFDMHSVQIVRNISDELNNCIYKHYMDNINVVQQNNILPDAHKYILKRGLLMKPESIFL